MVGNREHLRLDAYLEEWRRGEPQQRDGTAQEIAQAVADEMEAKFKELLAAATTAAS